jgi:hypothetical protein
LNYLAGGVSAVPKEIVLLRDRGPNLRHLRDASDCPSPLGAPDRLAEAEEVLKLLDHEETEETVDAAALEVGPAKNASCLNFSYTLSRACLGKMIVF